MENIVDQVKEKVEEVAEAVGLKQEESAEEQVPSPEQEAALKPAEEVKSEEEVLQEVKNPKLNCSSCGGSGLVSDFARCLKCSGTGREA